MTFERRKIRAQQGAPKSTLSSAYFLALSNSFVVSSFTTRKNDKDCKLQITCHYTNSPFKRRDCESNMTLFPESESNVAMSRAASSLRNCRNPLLFRIASPISSALRASPCARTIMDWGGGNQHDSVSIK